uniref:non-specific serine/threonine protein kinase n=1 Tax=Glossina brevipalpis TaxID=37001 RepID=A0A1A9WVM7_9MUSC
MDKKIKVTAGNVNNNKINTNIGSLLTSNNLKTLHNSTAPSPPTTSTNPLNWRSLNVAKDPPKLISPGTQHQTGRLLQSHRNVTSGHPTIISSKRHDVSALQTPAKAPTTSLHKTHISNNTALPLANANQTLSSKVTACITTPMDQLTAMHAKVTSNRNKNEEAIHDLRTRIPEIENIFDVHSRIGNGTFSTVLLGTLKKERELPENQRRKFAIKHHIPTSHPDRIMKELQCMAKIGGSDNVVGINCCIRYNESVAFIMPYLAHDRFHDFYNKMDVAEVQFYLKNLLIALRHVHKFNVIHRDVKPSNFLYNRRKRQFLLVDFGLAQQIPSSYPTLLNGIGNKINNLSLPAPTSSGAEGKRARDDEEYLKKTTDEFGKSPVDVVSGTTKRLRSNGPQGDTQQAHTRSALLTGAKLTQDQTADSKVGGKAASQSKGSQRLSSKTQRTQGGADGNSGGKMSTSGATANNLSNALVPATHNGIVENKYNTTRNLTPTANAAKCYCYGNPQVCNICLVKKEIHASRAGTPGYRPPEVLLKYPDQTTAVDVWAAGVIFLSIMSSVYPFFKAPNDYVALAEMVTIFGDRTIRKTAFILDRLVTLSQKTKPLDLRKLCVRFRNRAKFSSPELLKKYQKADGTCEVCKNCDQFFFNCLCVESNYITEPLDGDDVFPASAYDLLYKLLEVNPHKRITADEALNHPFFQESFNNNNATSTSHTVPSTGSTKDNAQLSLAAAGDSPKKSHK